MPSCINSGCLQEAEHVDDELLRCEDCGGPLCEDCYDEPGRVCEDCVAERKLEEGGIPDPSDL